MKHSEWVKSMAYASRGKSIVLTSAQAEAEYAGWLAKLLTDPVKGLENYTELFKKLTSPNGAIKVFCQVAEL
jgi:hypothetical protein